MDMSYLGRFRDEYHFVALVHTTNHSKHNNWPLNQDKYIKHTQKQTANWTQRTATVKKETQKYCRKMTVCSSRQRIQKFTGEESKFITVWCQLWRACLLSATNYWNCVSYYRLAQQMQGGIFWDILSQIKFGICFKLWLGFTQLSITWPVTKQIPPSDSGFQNILIQVLL